AHLVEVVERARNLNESTLLTDHGGPVARVIPVRARLHTVCELLNWLPTRPRLRREEAEAFAADVETRVNYWPR
ncbi:hypothetical protein HYR69_04655, partial [Candidatus Sumerlaeota bacterium]|nr:hypothetical protein [Candidatus Sumerlaeota bacterium]